ncbi:MAG TPA: 7TM domain-containing protein [Vitreimonas sp.]|nr:7TM domain-containing protein [Vitreimonas sp.]
MHRLTYLFILFGVMIGLCLLVGTPAQAQVGERQILKASPSSQTVEVITSPSSEPEGIVPIASQEAMIATPAAELINRLQEERRNQDITESTGERKSSLAAYLESHPISPLSWHNFLQHSIRRSINNGLPANVLVLILLFPVITSLIAVSRHVIGLKGFGIYTPAVLAVAFVSTGILTGIVLFGVILIAVVIFRPLVKRLELQYLPRTALLLWGVSLFTLLFLVASSLLQTQLFLGISIFPLLIMMLLTENFMETQLTSSQSQAFQLTAETLLIATICSLLVGSEMVQQWVILNPEITIIAVAVFNIIVGHYTGLRLMEYIRFRPLLNE